MLSVKGPISMFVVAPTVTTLSAMAWPSTRRPFILTVTVMGEALAFLIHRIVEVGTISPLPAPTPLGAAKVRAARPVWSEVTTVGVATVMEGLLRGRGGSPGGDEDEAGHRGDG